VQDKFLHSSGKDASPRRPVVPAGRPYHEKNFVLRPAWALPHLGFAKGAGVSQNQARFNRFAPAGASREFYET
jgi:hypothetical protein